MIVLRRKNYSVPKPGNFSNPSKPNAVPGQQNKVSSPNSLPQQGNRGNSQEVTARNLQVEQLRSQRQQAQSQSQAAQLQMRNEMQKRRVLMQRQKMESEEKQEFSKNMFKLRQAQDKSQNPNNIGLYKSKAKTVQPVPMKG